MVMAGGGVKGWCVRLGSKNGGVGGGIFNRGEGGETSFLS